MQSQLCSFPSKVFQFSHCGHCIVSLDWRQGLLDFSILSRHGAILIFMSLHVKIRDLSLLLPGPSISQLQVDFFIIAVDVLDRQSLGVRFQTPNFFSTIAIVSLNIQSLFGP